jgi:hypothetical protein
LADKLFKTDSNIQGTTRLPVVLRAGFKESGVSIQANRLVERHQLEDGRAYWKSYDFVDNEDACGHDLFLKPLGPPGYGLSKDDRLAFRHDGGELIFHLPNGLQGYLLTTATGKNLDRAPANVVQDRQRNDSQIINGISCIKCHDQGMKEIMRAGPLLDQIKPAVLGEFGTLAGILTQNERRAIASLYASEKQVTEALSTDRLRFQHALEQANAAGFAEEPVAALYETFLRDITEPILITELDLNPDSLGTSLASVLRESDNLAIRASAAQLGRGFQRREFIPLFQAIAAELYGKNRLHKFATQNFEEFGSPLPPAKPCNPDLAAPPPLSEDEYVVKSGDTMTRILEHLNKSGKPVTLEALSKANPILNTAKLKVGQKLLIPHPQQTPSLHKPSFQDFTKESPFTNSLGMKFVPVPGTEVLFCIWETRKVDYTVYALENSGVSKTWQKQMFHGRPVSSGDNHPVVSVNWSDAKGFCAWLTAKEQNEGKLPKEFHYRLPYDSEWSAAVGLVGEKGNTPHDRSENVEDLYPWGRQWPPPQGIGNYADSTERAHLRDTVPGYLDGFSTTAPVGCFSANAFGLYDLGGNVWEWCEDKFSPDAENRLLRGAAWNHGGQTYLRSSYRFEKLPSYRDDSLGFRAVLGRVER